MNLLCKVFFEYFFYGVIANVDIRWRMPSMLMCVCIYINFFFVIYIFLYICLYK